MKYLQQNLFNGDIEVSEAPIPKIEKNEVLIKSINTLISSGTERSLIEFGNSTKEFVTTSASIDVSFIIADLEADIFFVLVG